nr:MAG TPA: hypothetical protein [Bacteriophage sp.]
MSIPFRNKFSVFWQKFYYFLIHVWLEAATFFIRQVVALLQARR